MSDITNYWGRFKKSKSWGKKIWYLFLFAVAIIILIAAFKVAISELVPDRWMVSVSKLNPLRQCGDLSRGIKGKVSFADGKPEDFSDLKVELSGKSEGCHYDLILGELSGVGNFSLDFDLLTPECAADEAISFSISRSDEYKIKGKKERKICNRQINLKLEKK